MITTMTKDGRKTPIASVGERLSSQLRRIQGRPLTFDMDVWEGLSYGQHPEQSLDVWELNDLAPRAGWPAVLFLHGGGWVSGSRDSFRVQAPLLARQGILVASASYRLGEAGQWPAQLDDVIAAIDRLLGLQINPKRIGLWGVSAGGHLALCAAQQLGPERIRAVVTIGAPTDLPALAQSERSWPELEVVFGRDHLDEASPALNSTGLPPVLALHGTRDKAVPFSQAERLATQHSNVEILPVKGADHLLRMPPGVGKRAQGQARKWLAQQVADHKRGSKWKIRRS